MIFKKLSIIHGPCSQEAFFPKANTVYVYPCYIYAYV